MELFGPSLSEKQASMKLPSVVEAIGEIAETVRRLDEQDEQIANAIGVEKGQQLLEIMQEIEEKTGFKVSITLR